MSTKSKELQPPRQKPKKDRDDGCEQDPDVPLPDVPPPGAFDVPPQDNDYFDFLASQTEPEPEEFYPPPMEGL